MSKNGISKRKSCNRSVHRCYLCCSKDIDRSFFKFPSDKEIRLKWMKFCEMLPEDFSENFRLCHLHFDSKHLIDKSYKVGRRYLGQNAVPSLYFDEFSNLASAISISESQENHIVPTTVTLSHNNEFSHPVLTKVKNVLLIKTYNNDIQANERLLFPENICSPDLHSFKRSRKTRVITESAYASCGNENIENSYPLLTSGKNISLTNKPSSLEVTLSSSRNVENVECDNIESYIEKHSFSGNVRFLDLHSVEDAEKSFRLVMDVIQKKNKMIKVLKQRNCRLQKKMTSMKQLIKILQDKNMLSTAVVEKIVVFDNSF